MTGVAAAWRELHRQAKRLKPLHLRELFAGDPLRFGLLSAKFDDVLLDFSKEKLDAEALNALLALARSVGVEALRDALFAGEPVNVTENRPALHMALRGGAGERVVVNGADIMPDITATLDRFLAFADQVRADTEITDVIAIGIGGSSLGPEMATRALAPWHNGPRVHFVANVDGADFRDAAKPLDPRHTLVTVASKSFTTQETMTNARSALAWLAGTLGDNAAGRMAAVSANPAAAAEFGIDSSRVFGFRDWVGGRYSVWSAIGLPLAIAIGPEQFRAFLDGARAMDTHFRTVPLERNLPVLMGLITVWRRSAMGWPTTAIVPYDQRLARLPAWFQQVEMESNGKGVTLAGGRASASAPVVWGEPGTSAQHTFFQMLHQGPDVVPVDFLLAAEPDDSADTRQAEHHAQLAANALAQSAALAFGRTEAEIAAAMSEAGVASAAAARLSPHRACPGDRPSSTLLYRRLDPPTLGRLLALFEHKVFVEAAIWDINPFDQWGVELGKEIANRLLPAVSGEGGAGEIDTSTAGLLAHYTALKAGKGVG